MKKYNIIPLVLAAFLAAAPLAGCSNNNPSDSSALSSDSVVVPTLEGIADEVISANVAEEAVGNDTVFTLNGIIDSGMTDNEGNRYVYVDAVIKNNTDKEYEINALNNFYLLLPDSSESHYDVRTQLYGQKNVEGYITNPFTVPANGEISGIFGGFLIPSGVDELTVCFFPTQENLTDKSNVIKVDANASNFTTLTPAN